MTEFKISLLADALTELRKFEAELKVKSSYLTQLRVDVSNPTASLALLKGGTSRDTHVHCTYMYAVPYSLVV